MKKKPDITSLISRITAGAVSNNRHWFECLPEEQQAVVLQTKAEVQSKRLAAPVVAKNLLQYLTNSGVSALPRQSTLEKYLRKES